MTHGELVKIAARWLSTTLKCGAVVTEVSSDLYGETPDAIGWRGRHSIVVECKVSRGDFLCDKHKMVRKEPKKAMGVLRYYLAPKGLLTPADVAGTGWGLLETTGKRVMVIVPAEPFTVRSVKAEMALMYTALQRVQFRIDRPLSEVVSWSSLDMTFNVMPPCEDFTEKFLPV